MFDIHGRIMVEQVMELFAEVGHSGGGPSIQSTYVQDNRPLTPPPIHVAVPVDEAEESEEESDEDYVADSGDSGSSDSGMRMKTSVPTAARHVLPPPLPIPTLSEVPSHYHSLDLDAMHERTPFLNMGEEDCNLDGSVESREAVLQSVKNYSIRRSAEYRVIESDRLKCHVQCCQADNGSQWSLRVALRQNLGYCCTKCLNQSCVVVFREVRRLSSTHHVSRPSPARQQSDMPDHLAFDLVQPLCQHSNFARCGPSELSLQNVLQKGVDGQAEGNCTNLWGLGGIVQ
ncbi:hypothetical protein Ahy_A03g012338 [Arachis hypogaea]|uniref:Transposase MuDR plant domain-containing protein n=1 Tax=Arachis hypogaea TaxID=3818 RepID=A0A445DT44_ARAHY|nr:hypothetical protein Ahy_A03g012338 [Arachis hypogaea]